MKRSPEELKERIQYLDRELAAGMPIKEATAAADELRSLRQRISEMELPFSDSLDIAQADMLHWASTVVPGTNWLTKTREEMAEFFENPSMEEAADVALCLMAYVAINGRRLGTECNRKMQINRARKQERQPDGTWHHVKENDNAIQEQEANAVDVREQAKAR